MSGKDGVDEWESVGEGITARRKTIIKPQFYPPGSQAEIDSLEAVFDSVSAFYADPWASYRSLHKAISEAYDEIIATTSKADLAEQLSKKYERKSQAWYFREILFLGDRANSAIEKGDAALSAHAAFEMAELITEYNIAFGRGWNRFAIKGWTLHQRQSDANAGRRKGPPDEYRIETWLKYRLDGRGFKDADYLAAEELGISEARMRQVRSSAGYKRKGVARSD